MKGRIMIITTLDVLNTFLYKKKRLYGLKGEMGKKGWKLVREIERVCVKRKIKMSEK